MKNIEFYNFEREVWYRTADGRGEQLTEDNREVVELMIDKIKALYTSANKALRECYAKLSYNPKMFEYRIVKRFCKCNFGAIDTSSSDVDNLGRFNFEQVQCPLRGECKLEGIVCNPKFNSQISDSEMRVLELVFRGEEKEYIADKLCLSPHTINNHIRNAYTRLGFHEKAEFIDYAHVNNLFKDE